MKNSFRFPLLIGVSLILGGCSSPQSFMNSASLISGHEVTLFKELLVEALFIFVLIVGALAWIFIRDRNRGESKSTPPQLYGKLSLIAIPVAMIILLDGFDFALMARTMKAIAIPKASAQDINVHIIGHRWWWEYDYTDLGITTANELHIPVGSTIQVTLDSVDVIHSFWVPQLSGKTDVIPGQTNHMWLTADKPGTYIGQCAEFCGTEHALMRLRVIVQTQADFDAWVANQQQAAAVPQTADEIAGYKLATTLCASCHSLNPAETEFKTGPNLAHLFSRTTFGGAVFDLNTENLRSWLTSTQSMKPGNDMTVRLTHDQIEQLLAYLSLLK